MIAIPEMLVAAAEAAGIPVPPDVRNPDAKKYLWWMIFANAQLCRPMPNMGCHWANAKVVAALTEEELRTITIEQLIAKGFEIGHPTP